MKKIKTAFHGRLVFDHLPKTAGQAINSWLTEELGTGCVTTNLIGDHLDLIREYGGPFSVISGHVQFKDATGLDPRYQYMTLLRQPVDRVVSWLYFVISNHDDSQLPGLRAAAVSFVESDGAELPEFLTPFISNAYIEHFCTILGNGSDPSDIKMANAIGALELYDVVGIYDNMPQFLAEAAALIGLASPKQIARVNVTKQRPQVEQISTVLHDRISALNELDLRFYAQVSAWKSMALTSKSHKHSAATKSKWKRYDRPSFDSTITSPDFHILNATIRENSDVRQGQLVTFDVDIFLGKKVQDLEIGIHILDSDRKWAFGINSTLLGHSHKLISSGMYRVSHHIIADLPTGKYTAGFAFNEQLPAGALELAWQDAMCDFYVHREIEKPFAGYCYLPAEIGFSAMQVASSYQFLGSDVKLSTEVGLREASSIGTSGQAGYLVFGPYVPIMEGHYRIAIHFTVGAGGIADAHLDVATHRGAVVLGAYALEEPDSDGCFVLPPILVDKAYPDIETRIWVSNKTEIQISMIEIERVV